MTVMNAVQCGSHIPTLWTSRVEDYLEYCIFVFPFLVGFAISNFLLDLLILVLPIPKVRVDFEMSRYESRLQASDLVLACKESPEVGCDWSFRFGRNVSNVPNIPLGFPTQPIKLLLLPVA